MEPYVKEDILHPKRLGQIDVQNLSDEELGGLYKFLSDKADKNQQPQVEGNKGINHTVLPQERVCLL